MADFFESLAKSGSALATRKATNSNGIDKPPAKDSEQSGDFFKILERQRVLAEQAGISTDPQQNERLIRKKPFLELKLLEAGIPAASFSDKGFTDLSQRFDLGFSDTLEEKKGAFMRKNPDGDFIIVDNPPIPDRLKGSGFAEGTLGNAGRGGQTVLVRKSQDDPFVELDPNDGGFVEMIGDIADLSGELPAIAFEVFITRGAGLIKNIIQGVSGQVIGDLAKEGAQELRGLSEETMGDITRS